MLLTSVDVLTKYWPFGHHTLFLCRVAKAGPCFAVYYSSFTVVAIAIDRHRCIVHSDAKQVGLQWVINLECEERGHVCTYGTLYSLCR